MGKFRDLDKMDDMLDQHFSNDKGIKSGAKQQGRAVPEQQRQQIGNAMRGKTLEELVGEEAAARGKEARRQANYKQDYTGRGKKIAATRRARGSYDGRSMRGKEHKESTKATMQVKAKIRQDLRRTLNMGKSGTLPKELLEAEYKRAGL
jgi:hypothetical protein